MNIKNTQGFKKYTGLQKTIRVMIYRAIFTEFDHFNSKAKNGNDQKNDCDS